MAETNSSKKSRRNALAKEAMIVMLQSQCSHRRMTLLNRIKFALGLDGWTANFDCNSKDIAKKSYEIADTMLSAENEKSTHA